MTPTRIHFINLVELCLLLLGKLNNACKSCLYYVTYIVLLLLGENGARPITLVRLILMNCGRRNGGYSVWKFKWVFC